MLSLRAQHPWSVLPSTDPKAPSTMIREGVTDRNLNSAYLWLFLPSTGRVMGWEGTLRTHNSFTLNEAQLDNAVKILENAPSIDRYWWAWDIMVEEVLVDGIIRVTFDTENSYFDAEVLNDAGDVLRSITAYADDIAEALSRVEQDGLLDA